MKIDLTASPVDMYGLAIPNPHKDGPSEWPLFEVAAGALIHPTKEPVSAGQSVERYKLMRRLMDDGPKGAVEISTGEAELIKAAAAALYGPIVVGQLDAAIEGNA